VPSIALTAWGHQSLRLADVFLPEEIVPANTGYGRRISCGSEKALIAEPHGVDRFRG
jgi:hypothetical protein